MEPFEIELKKALTRTDPMPADELAALNDRIVRTFARKQQSAFRLMSAYLVVLTILIIALLALFMSTTDLKQCLHYGILILILFEGTVLMKLWFWILHSKIATVREIKLLQLAVAELKTRTSPEPPPGTAPFFQAKPVPASAPTPTAPSTHRSWWPILGAIWLLAVASLVYLVWVRNDHVPRNFAPYLEKTFSVEDVGKNEWQETFEVKEPRRTFHPRVVTAGTSARIWISVAAEGHEPMFTMPVNKKSGITFGEATQGRYVIKAKVLEANDDCTLRLGGVDKLRNWSSFELLFPLLLSAALVFAIPVLWLQDRWYRRFDPEPET